MTVLPLWALVAAGFATSAVGALGGIGGAVLLVPALVLLGVSPLDAAPLGLLSVAAGSLAAGSEHLREGVVHHRLGVVVETTATVGAFAGALASTAVAAPLLVRLLGVAALAAGAAGLARRGMRNLPHPEFVAETPGEWPGTLSGAYRAVGGVVPYNARRLLPGLCATGFSGLLAGLVGASGAFIKTPTMSEVMHVPVKVAAATTTFTVGVTAAAGLAVFAAQGRLEVVGGAAVVVGSLAGGGIGARLQLGLSPPRVRQVVSLLLVAVGAVLLVGA